MESQRTQTTKHILKKEEKRLGCNSVVECMLSMYLSLGSIRKEKGERRKKKRKKRGMKETWMEGKDGGKSKEEARKREKEGRK
jgi:hypothetical protein